jgi:L-amino acid N-acyltransferase YncA
VRIIEKGILDLTAQEMRQCKSLSLRHQGLMCEDLVDWKDYESRPNRAKRKTRIWMIKDDADRLIGWALATPRWKARGYDAQFYVRISERGKGYGTLLMKKVLELDPKPHVFPHDKTSGDFFKRHSQSIRFSTSDKKWIET